MRREAEVKLQTYLDIAQMSRRAEVNLQTHFRSS